MVANRVFRVYDDEEAMLDVYQRRLARADDVFERRKPELEKFINRYRQRIEEDQVTDAGHRVAVTKGVSVIDTMFASMVAVDVEFLVHNIGHGTREQAYAATRGLNQAWRDTKGSRRAREAIKDAELVDVGWVKVYYDYVEDVMSVPRPEEAIRAQMQELLGENPDLTDDDLEKLVPDMEDVEVVLRDRVCVDYVPWDKIRYDPTAKRIEDVRWVAQYTLLPLAEVTQNVEFQAFVEDRYGVEEGRRKLRDLNGDTAVRAADEAPPGHEMGAGATADREFLDDNARVTVVEMWDLETGLVTIFPRAERDLVLFQRPNPLMFNLDLEDRNPFKPLILRKDPDTFEGQGDMRVMMPALEELDEYRSNMATHIARTIPKIIGPEGALSSQGKKALESRTWGAYIGLNQQATANDITPLVPPPLPQAVFDVPGTIAREVDESIGVNDAMRGIFPSKRTTATETNIVTTRSDARQAERRQALMDWYGDIARTMLQLMQRFYDRDRMFRYVDEAGREFEWTWSAEDIAIEADLDVSLTPRENLTRDDEFQRMIQVMNLTLPLPETDRTELIRRVLISAGLSEDDARAIVKTPEEVQAEQAAAQAEANLSVAPQARGSGPPGLAIGGVRG